METQNIDKIAAAFVKAQREFGAAKKDTKNEFFHSKYADMAAVADACMDALAANEIAVMQDVETVMKPIPPETALRHFAVVQTKLLHSSGQTMQSKPLELPILPMKAKDGRDLPVSAQACGSAITYARRYSLAAFVGVVTEDDDGNSASGQQRPSSQSREPVATVPQTASQVKDALTASIAQQEKMEILRADFNACTTLEALTAVWHSRSDLRKEIGKENSARLVENRKKQIDAEMAKEAKKAAKNEAPTEAKSTDDVKY